MTRPARFEVGGLARADALQELQRRGSGSSRHGAMRPRPARPGHCNDRPPGRGRRRSAGSSPAARTDRRGCTPSGRRACASSRPTSSCSSDFGTGMPPRCRPTSARTGRVPSLVCSMPVTVTGTWPPSRLHRSNAPPLDGVLPTASRSTVAMPRHRAVADDRDAAGSVTPSRQQRLAAVREPGIELVLAHRRCGAQPVAAAAACAAAE